MSSLLQPAVSSSAFLKMGLLGFQGGGKTLTAGKVAIGLVKHLQGLGIDYASKPVAMFDTEKGSDWLIPIFKAAGVPFVVAKKKTFADLLTVMKEAEQHASALIIDSITHPWRELVESYLRKKERSYLAMDDWGYLKGEHGWQQFTDAYVNSKLHIIMAGRAGYEYENYVEDGRKKMEKVGTKMKTEGETGFEPDLLVLMEQVEDMHTNKVVHRATVQKDRSTLLDGKTFDNPGFEDFLPHVKCLALGEQHVGVGESRDSQHILKIEKRDWQPVQRRIVHDEIKDLLLIYFPGQTATEKTGKVKAMLAAFDASWAEIEEVMSLPALRAGYDKLHVALTGQPSKYAALVAAIDGDMNDSLPEHSAPPAAVVHKSDCALHNGPAYPAGPCDCGDIAPGGNGEHKPAKDLLLADLANLTTMADCVSWGMTVSNMKHLSADDHIALGNALRTRQTEINKNTKPGGDDGGDADPKKNEPDGGKPDAEPGQGKPPVQEPNEQRPQAAKTTRKAKDAATNEDVLPLVDMAIPAERTMAELVTIG